jgi:hypothetical protein
MSLSDGAARAGGAGGGGGAALGVAFAAPLSIGAVGFGVDFKVGASAGAADARTGAADTPMGGAGLDAPGKALGVGLDLAARA